MILQLIVRDYIKELNVLHLYSMFFNNFISHSFPYTMRNGDGTKEGCGEDAADTPGMMVGSIP